MNGLTLIKPYSIKELCHLYGISHKTFRKWILPFMAKIGQRRGLYYNINQVKIIFTNLGAPDID